ncbi:hypothetical protein Tco_1545510 [Tanacetum coccineum]
MSLGHSARVTEAMDLSDSPFRKRYRSSYETPSPSPSLTLLVQKRYRGTSELILDTDSEGDELGDEEDESSDADDERESQGLGDKDHGLDDESQGLEDKGLGLEGEEVIPEGQQQAVPVVETTASEPLGLGYGALRHRELVVEEDQVPSTFVVRQSSRSVPERQGAERVSAFRHPTLVTWIDPEDDRVYTNILAYTPPAVPDYTQRLDVLPPTLIADIDRDVRDLYTRSGVVRDEIFSQSVGMAGHVDTRLANMSRARYDDHRLIHDMLVQQAAMQRQLQEMRGRVTALEKERDRREQ